MSIRAARAACAASLATFPALSPCLTIHSVCGQRCSIPIDPFDVDPPTRRPQPGFHTARHAAPLNEALERDPGGTIAAGELLLDVCQEYGLPSTSRKFPTTCSLRPSPARPDRPHPFVPTSRVAPPNRPV